MARMREPRFKKCRRLDLNVTGHPKAMKRAGNGQARNARKLSPYGTQLLEKQRLRSYYEVMEKQFRRYVKSAMNSDDGLTGEVLVKKLECRLDNIVYRMNFANSIRQARQLVVHGHILVNGKKVDRPSFAVSPGDKVSLKEKTRSNEMIKEFFTNQLVQVPYISVDTEKFEGVLERMPERSEVPIEIQDHLVVEFYSKNM